MCDEFDLAAGNMVYVIRNFAHCLLEKRVATVLVLRSIHLHLGTQQAPLHISTFR